MKIKPLFTSLAWLSVFAGFDAVADNPLVPGIGLTDPHGTIYGDRAYIYATHDFSPDSKKFVTKDWWVWSSTDLVNWTQAGTLKPEETFLKRPSDECWAGFGASKNEKYYWYFSAGPTQVGVVMADTPIGPWRDPLGKPMIPKGLTDTEARDPDIMMDDDRQAYMVYGTFKYFIVRLNENMISLAETPRRVQLDHEFGPYGAGKTDDKPSLHKRNGIYYLSWSSFYAMSTNVYGPYTFKGSVIDQTDVAPQFQMDGNRNGGLRHDRHGNFFSWHSQWYYACNDKSQPGRSSHFRDCCLSYVHYRDNGEMAPIRLDAIGVGQYDAAHPKIEAEDYFAMENARVKESPAGGFEIQNITNNSFLKYPHVKHLKPNNRISFRVSSANPKGGNILIHEGGPDGSILGHCSVPCTQGWEKYQLVSCDLNNAAGTADLCLTFEGTGELMHLDWMTFSNLN